MTDYERLVGIHLVGRRVIRVGPAHLYVFRSVRRIRLPVVRFVEVIKKKNAIGYRFVAVALRIRFRHMWTAQNRTTAHEAQGVLKRTYRRIGAHILRHAGGLTGGAVQDVPEDTCRLGFLGVLTGAAGEEETTGFGVFFGIQHVGAFGAEAEADLLEVLLVGVGGCRSWSRHGCG